MRKRLNIMILLTVGAILCTNAYSQPKTVGVSFCFAGIGLNYEHVTSEDAFINFQIRTETADYFVTRFISPGLSASLSWNMPIGEKVSRNGNVINFFAGPGIAGGLASDLTAQHGLFAGLMGRIGGECAFDRGITISASISPLLGVHLSRMNDYLSMRLFRNGIIYGLMPEIGIKYTFGK